MPMFLQKGKILELHVMLLQMLGVPRSRYRLSLPGFQTVGSFLVALYYPVGSLPFRTEFPFSWIPGHQIYFPQHPVSNLKLSLVNRFVIVPGYPSTIGLAHCLRIFSPLLQQIKTPTNSFIITVGIIICYPITWGAYLHRYDRLSPIC